MMYANLNAAQHSDRPMATLMTIPGHEDRGAHATGLDVKGLLKTAIRDDDPVIVFDDCTLWTVAADVPMGSRPVARRRCCARGQT